MTNIAAALDRAIRAAGVTITGVSLGRLEDKATGRVAPADLQSAAQATIDTFDPNVPAHDITEQDAAAREGFGQRLLSAFAYVLLRRLFPTDTVAQTKAKFGIMRDDVVAAYKARPWL